MENNNQQQLDLILDMIHSARQEFTDDSMIYLLWGWAVSLAALGEFVLIKMNNQYHAIVWAIAIPLAIIAQIVIMYRSKKKEKVKSHLDRVFGYVWMAVGLCIGGILFSSNVLQLSTYPVLMLLYAIGTFISGGIMKFKPMMIGAALCWAIALAAFHVSFEYQLLLLSLSLVVAYIIPGHLLKIHNSKNV